MAETQRPKDDVGSPQEKSGKKKPPTGPKVSPSEMAEESSSEILAQYSEQDEQDGLEIEDLASVPEEEEQGEADYDEDQDDDDDNEEPAEGDEDQGEIIDQGEHGEDHEEQSSSSEEEPVAETSSGEEDRKESDEVDEELIESTVDELIENEQLTDEEHYGVINRIVDKFLGGDYKAASDKNPWKTNALKKLRDHERLPITPRRLGDRIRATGCRAGVIARNPKIDLPRSVWLELVPIDDEDKLDDLALEAYEKKLSVRLTRKRVRDITKKPAPKPVTKLFAELKNPRNLPLAKDYEKINAELFEVDLSKRERHLLRAAIAGKREHMGPCGQFLDKLENWLADIDL